MIRPLKDAKQSCLKPVHRTLVKYQIAKKSCTPWISKEVLTSFKGPKNIRFRKTCESFLYHLSYFYSIQVATSQYQMGSIDIIQPSSIVLSNAVNKSQRHQEKNSFECRAGLFEWRDPNICRECNRQCRNFKVSVVRLLVRFLWLGFGCECTRFSVEPVVRGMDGGLCQKWMSCPRPIVDLSRAVMHLIWLL